MKIDLSNIEGITCDPDVRGGEPVLTGTRFPLSTLLAELADSRAMLEVVQDYDLPYGLPQKALEKLAAAMLRPL